MTNIEDFRNYCLTFNSVTEKFPFNDRTLVFYVMGKIFCLVDINEFNYCNLKCDPDQAEELRAMYHGVEPGYHMNKKHWNSVYFDKDVPLHLIHKMVENSYRLVVKNLPKKEQMRLNKI